MIKAWADVAWDEYVDWQKTDKKTLNKINELIKSIDRNGYNCVGKPEELHGNFAGYWSVHIDKKNRLIFLIDDDEIQIIRCGSHYDDR
ncbi:addiction module toxin, Txe/YoeB family protein [Clostridia bacterium]|nr:addiction module toxin, Txe/YoeB family protein [Clostridia bacterium]